MGVGGIHLGNEVEEEGGVWEGEVLVEVEGREGEEEEEGPAGEEGADGGEGVKWMECCVVCGRGGVFSCHICQLTWSTFAP